MVEFHFTLKGMFKGGNKTNYKNMKGNQLVWQLLFPPANGKTFMKKGKEEEMACLQLSSDGV